MLDPVEHQSYLWASEGEIEDGKSGKVDLEYITPPNKNIKLDAYKLRRGTVVAAHPNMRPSEVHFHV